MLRAWRRKSDEELHEEDVENAQTQAQLDEVLREMREQLADLDQVVERMELRRG
jgi:hypothetical protein